MNISGVIELSPTSAINQLFRLLWKAYGRDCKYSLQMVFKQSTISCYRDWTYTALYYRKTSNISRTLVGNKIVDNSDVVGASPVGAAPTTSSLST